MIGMRVGRGLSPFEPIGHTHRSPLPTVLNMKAIPHEILEEVIVREFSISIRHLSPTNTSK